jgi:hypothetical protein
MSTPAMRRADREAQALGSVFIGGVQVLDRSGSFDGPLDVSVVDGRITGIGPVLCARWGLRQWHYAALRQHRAGLPAGSQQVSNCLRPSGAAFRPLHSGR